MTNPGLSVLAHDVMRTCTMVTCEAIDRDSTVTGVVRLVAMTARFADDSARFAARNSSSELQPACRRGCTSCCHLHVVSIAAEVMAIASQLRSTLSEVDLDALKERLNQHVDATRGLPADGCRRLRIPCPLLDEQGDCLAYASRPITCRGWNSLDASLCDADHREPSQGTPAKLNLAQYLLAGRILEGLAAGLHTRRLDHRRLDLVRALKVILESAESAREWRKGTRIFESTVNDLVFPDSDDAEVSSARQILWKTLGPEFASTAS